MNQQAWDITLEHLDGGYDGRIVLKDFSRRHPRRNHHHRFSANPAAARPPFCACCWA